MNYKQMIQRELPDAELAAQWLNESPRVSRNRVLGVYRQLEAFRDGISAVRDMTAEGQANDGSGRKVDAGWSRKYRRAMNKSDEQLKTLNRTLKRYVFRPGIGHSVTSLENGRPRWMFTNLRASGMLPDNRGFRLTVGGWEFTEADAALALVRLYLAGDLAKVHLCDQCGRRWHFAAKSHYRFCSSECREAYYLQAPAYQERRKKIQQDYRDRQKRNKALGYRPKP